MKIKYNFLLANANGSGGSSRAGNGFRLVDAIGIERPELSKVAGLEPDEGENTYKREG